MPRDNAKKVLENPSSSREEVARAIMWLTMDLLYVVDSLKGNPAQETQADIRESQELLERLKVKLATLE